MNKKLWFYAVVGVLVGAAVVQTAHVIHDRNSRELFAERLRCKALADKYAKENSNPYYLVVIERIEFSGSRSSCIASTAEQSGPLQKPSSDWAYKVVDLLTGEDIAVRRCSGNDKCAQSMRKRDEAFEKTR